MIAFAYLLVLITPNVSSFSVNKGMFGSPKPFHDIHTKCRSSTIDTDNEIVQNIDENRLKRKEILLQLLGSPRKSEESPNTGYYDPILACPETKEALRITSTSPLIEGGAAGVKVSLRSSSDSEKSYEGRTDTFYNLLEANEDTTSDDAFDEEPQSGNNAVLKDVLNSLRVFIPPQLRMAGALAGIDDTYIPMRDLFTSPAVSFAYERGWRQNFAVAGFPGPDKEFEMVQEFFAPVISDTEDKVVVDMSCATGLFTRRLAKSGAYSRVIGCDYSESMLTEARGRINADPELKDKKTRIDLVRLDVSNIPMRTESLNALHAGAAMHCWPDVVAGLSEIYRVLRPGGRYFASTFLSEYFSTVRLTDAGSNTQQAFQYFESTDKLKDMLLEAGFEDEKINIEVLGRACVIIKCEK